MMAKALVANLKNKAKLKAKLFDNGSHKSYITNSMAKKLGLKAVRKKKFTPLLLQEQTKEIDRRNNMFWVKKIK